MRRCFRIGDQRHRTEFVLNCCLALDLHAGGNGLTAEHNRELTMKIRMIIWATFCMAMLSLLQASQAATPSAVVSINGHGLWVRNTGDHYENQQPYLESTMIDAWLDADGQAHGTIVWMDVLNGIFDQHGPGYSGYTWKIDVDTIVFNPDLEDPALGVVFVAGVVTQSNVKADIGQRTGFYVAKFGAGEGDHILPAGGEINWYFFQFFTDYAMPILNGNFSIR